MYRKVLSIRPHPVIRPLIFRKQMVRHLVYAPPCQACIKATDLEHMMALVLLKAAVGTSVDVDVVTLVDTCVKFKVS